MSKIDKQQKLFTENAELRVALRQAQEFCINKEKKSIEYIYHLGQFKSHFCNQIESLIFKFLNKFNSSSKNKPILSLIDHEAAYLDWLAKFDALDGAAQAKINAHILELSGVLNFSIILDCREQDILSIDKTLDSLRRQIYKNYDIVLCGEADFLEKLKLHLEGCIDPKIQMKYLKTLPCASFKETLLAAVSSIEKSYVACLEAGSELHPTALYEFAADLNLYPETEAIYADQDEIDLDGRRKSPCFKPDWNLELFLAQNYVGSFCVFPRMIFQRSLKKLTDDDDCEALNFHALVSLAREKIRHIPTILFHHAERQLNLDWTRRTLSLTRQYLAERNPGAQIVHLVSRPDWLEVRRSCPSEPPLVSILIPTHNRPDLLNICLRGIINETNYKNIEVIIIDHENTHPNFVKTIDIFSKQANITVMPYTGEFDHSDMNNHAAEIAHGEILLFLNDDIEVIEPQWLDNIVAQFTEGDRGIVGARLLYPDRRIQHAGVILGLGGVAGHGHVGLHAEEEGYFGRLKLASEISALTGACMAIQRQLFIDVGGFTAGQLKRTFNDVDLCLKVRAKGKINIWTPLATLIHHESATDGGDIKLKQFKRLQSETSYMLRTWGLMRADPYYNVNLDLETQSFALSSLPRRVMPFEALTL